MSKFIHGMEAKRLKPNRKSASTKLLNSSRSDQLITVTLETTAPVSELHKKIGVRMKTKDLENNDIYLQDILLNPRLSLYDQAVKISGSVELSVLVDIHGQSGRFTIVEIAKNMTEDEIKALGNLGQYSSTELETAKASTSEIEEPSSSTPAEEDKWGIPSDPALWSAEQVYSWMLWVAKGYDLDSTLIKNPWIDGERLCALQMEEFFIEFPYGNIFWSHLSILKKLPQPNTKGTIGVSSDGEDEALNLVIKDGQIKAIPGVLKPNVTIQIMHGSTKSAVDLDSCRTKKESTVQHKSGAGGQIQLWQFLLEILTDADEQHVIQWVGDDGEFKFLSPEKVAQKWGGRKGKPAMNYEKLSRALRYYYDGDMISKVPGKRFQYKFVCDLKEILGYNAAELKKMVSECYRKRTEERDTSTYYGNLKFVGVAENDSFTAH